MMATFFPYKPEQANYLVNCSVRLGFVYIETPKVACSTIKRGLQWLEADGDVTLLSPDVHDRRASPLPDMMSSGVSLSELMTGERFFRFSYVRNPFTRIASAYLDKMVQDEGERHRLAPPLSLDPSEAPSFEEFLRKVQAQSDYDRDIHWASQAYLLQPDRVAYDLIGRFESLTASWPLVLDRISPSRGAEALVLRQDGHRTHAANRLHDLLTPPARRLVIDIYREDFWRFNYSTDPCFASF